MGILDTPMRDFVFLKKNDILKTSKQNKENATKADRRVLGQGLVPDDS